MNPPPRRKPTRMKGYDYASGGTYFVTICTHNREHLFGAVVDKIVRLNAWGRIAAQEWERTATLRSDVFIETFVIMPNHTHALVVIDSDHGLMRREAGVMQQTPAFSRPDPDALGAIVGAYKAGVTRAINWLREERSPIWQRNFHDHIVRNEDDFHRIYEYIEANPSRWHEDRFFAT